MPTASLEQRNKILSAHGGMAVKAGPLLAMKQAEGRKFIAGKRLVYIYHNEIDARGDKAATEGATFEAVRKAIRELADLVRYVVNNLNGNNVVITADHGFLFTETAQATRTRAGWRKSQTAQSSQRNDTSWGTICRLTSRSGGAIRR